MRTSFALLCSDPPRPTRLEELASLEAAELLVVSGSSRLPLLPAPLRLVRPLLRTGGAIGLLHAALLAARGEALVAIDGDGATVSPALLRGLAAHPARGNLLLVAGPTSGPLPGRYRRGCLRALRGALRRGEEDLFALTAKIPASLVGEDELCSLGLQRGLEAMRFT
jgi:molybdopterin-guanine dinucleotide biosynthesis protein A